MCIAFRMYHVYGYLDNDQWYTAITLVMSSTEKSVELYKGMYNPMGKVSIADALDYFNAKVSRQATLKNMETYISHVSSR